MQKLLVVDDEKDLRILIKQIFIPFSEIEVVEASNALVALEYLKVKKVGAILTDIKMPEMDGLEFIKRVRADGISVPIIFYSGFVDKEIALRALRLGAFEFIEKPFLKETMVSTVKNALMQQGLSTVAKLQRLGLNATQLRVMELLISGRSNKEIASVVNLTEQGIKYHVSNLLEKFEVKNRVQLRDMVWGLIDEAPRRAA
jgi:two-component system, LuxR family, response regulator FixJ